MNKCAKCQGKFIGWGWVVFDRKTQDSTGVLYCSEDCGESAISERAGV